VVLNAGAAVYVAGVVETLAAGVARAAEVIDAGMAREKFAALIEFTSQVG
jgi:anthranilate phosphoribosyltransferase